MHCMCVCVCVRVSVCACVHAGRCVRSARAGSMCKQLRARIVRTKGVHASFAMGAWLRIHMGSCREVRSLGGACAEGPQKCFGESIDFRVLCCRSASAEHFLLENNTAEALRREHFFLRIIPPKCCGGNISFRKTVEVLMVRWIVVSLENTESPSQA